jgi:hypothetical protein
MARAIAGTLNDQERDKRGEYPTSAFVTHLVYLARSGVEVDEAAITVSTPLLLENRFHAEHPQAMGVRCVRIDGAGNRFDELSVARAMSLVFS